jgi:hypothetical protein
MMTEGLVGRRVVPHTFVVEFFFYNVTTLPDNLTQFSL